MSIPATITFTIAFPTIAIFIILAILSTAALCWCGYETYKFGWKQSLISPRKLRKWEVLKDLNYFTIIPTIAVFIISIIGIINLT